VTTINDTTAADFLQINPAAIVMFGFSTSDSTWLMRPHLQRAALENHDITFAYCDVEGALELATNLGVMTLPTAVAFRDGRETNRVVGCNPSTLDVLIGLLRGSEPDRAR